MEPSKEDVPVQPSNSNSAALDDTPDQSCANVVEGSIKDSELVESEPTQPLSKKAQKRLAKAALFQEKKLEKRRREKAAKKEKKRERRERAEAGELDEEDQEHMRKRQKLNDPKNPFSARIVVDLGFDDKMNDKEISSLSSQLAYCYAANRRSPCPFSSIIFSSLYGRLKTRLDAENNFAYRRWTGCEWWEESYEHLWKQEVAVPKNEAEDSSIKEGLNLPSRCEKDTVVYLTADTDEELEELKEGETYILGGIVDHNRYKNLCKERADTSGIRTARLPIGKYMAEMTSRKVLTVNQVFEILINWVETRDWEKALYSVMPKRKFYNGSQTQTQNLQSGEESETIVVKEDDTISQTENAGEA